MTNQLFAAALGIAAPWFVQTVDFDAGQRRLTIHVDFVPGSRFAHAKAAGEHKVHDTQIKRLRHLNFFQHGSLLHKISDISVSEALRQVPPRHTGSISVQNRLNEQTIVRRGHAHMPQAPRQQILDPVPFVVVQSISPHRSALLKADRP